MKEIIDNIKGVKNLSDTDNLNDIDPNTLFLAIIKSERYDLLKFCNIKLHIDNSESSIQLIDHLLSDEDILYYMHQNNFYFSKENIDNIFKVIYEKYQDTYKINYFIENFFNDKESLNNFVKENEDFFIKYIHEKDFGISYQLKKCDSFIKLILKENYIQLISNLENYSSSNLKILVSMLQNKTELPYYLGNDKYAYHLFELKSNLDPVEFCELLNLLKDKSTYDSKYRNTENGIFTELVIENIDYLIDVISQYGKLPQCLVESSFFRDECIKRNRIDLAVQCILPNNIFSDDNLAKMYCDELKIDLKDFYSRGKWTLDYYEKNKNIFNSFVATTLKDHIFTLGEDHIERFINDTSIQMSIGKLNNKENTVLNKILKRYNYEEYDISFMITSILTNIDDYSELINSLNLASITDEELKTLISIIQIPKNPYNINNLKDLKDYRNKKKELIEKNYDNNNINFNKENLLQFIFNIDLKQAIFINKYFCYDRQKNVLEELKNSELPKNIFEYLSIINRIVETNNPDDIINIYNQYKNYNTYSSEIPLETYLRSEYTKLYSNSLYKIEEKENVYGPKDGVYQSINYNGQNIKVCIPREKFNFMVHCIGYCSLDSDVINANYQKDWEDRPQIQVHFLACSYLNEKGIYSTISSGNIILGFESFESSSLFGMGDTDIDSIGPYAKSYSPSKTLMELNGNRAHYFVPSLLANSINEGYNEIVLERRNYNSSNKEYFKRAPDYIIMMSDSLEQNNFTYLSDLYNTELSFVSKEDRELILKAKDESILKQILTKYKDIIIQNAKEKEIEGNKLLNIYVSQIIKSKYFENCLKASSEFNVPLVIVDKSYYFSKMLSESTAYDEETTHSIESVYDSADESTKKRIFNQVAKGLDITKFIQKQDSHRNSIKR